MTDLTFAPAAGAARQGVGTRLRAFVEWLADPAGGRSACRMALWASFLNKVQNDPQMKETHQRTYGYFRDFGWRR